MKRKSLIYIASLVLLAGCDYNDKYFDDLDEITKSADVKKLEYTLLDEDYATIAKNATNIALAASSGVSGELSSLATTKRFSETLPASLYAPAFIASKWYTADEGSSLKLTYNKYLDAPDYVTELNGISIYKVSAEDYASVWGEGSTTNFFTPATTAKANVPNILASAFPDAEDGTIVLVDYNESENEPSGAVVAVNEDFNIFTGTVNPVVLGGWNCVTTEGSYAWSGRIYNNNGYIQASAFGHTGIMETYMISPKFKVTPGLNLTFSACCGNYRATGGILTVLVSSNLASFDANDVKTATWDDITSSFSIEIPSGPTGYSPMANAGSHNLDAYIGKDLYVAFRYNGEDDGDTKTTTNDATTTIQVDDVVVKSEPSGGGDGDVYVATAGLYAYSGTAWTAYSGNGYLLTKADYTLMGLGYDNFSGTQPDHYIPRFLSQKFPFAQVDEIKVVTYKFYVDKDNTEVRADEYTYSGTAWEKNNYIEQVTDQFVFANGAWNYDPSVVITLKPGRSQPEIAKYFQAIADYVGAVHGIGYYQPGYTNAEYYYGASAYQNNFDFRVSAWRNGHANGAEYSSLSDAELESLMYERLKVAFIPALKANHGDLRPVDGVDMVTCTIYFGIYTGNTISSPTHVIVYKAVGPAEFEYVEDSFKPIQ